MTTKDVLLSKWYLLEEPWGRNAVLAIDRDPHRGILVCQNEFAEFNPEGYEDISMRQIMRHIVKTHNDWLPRLRRGGGIKNERQ